MSARWWSDVRLRTLVLVNVAAIVERADESLLPAVYNEVGRAFHTPPGTWARKPSSAHSCKHFSALRCSSFAFLPSPHSPLPPLHRDLGALTLVRALMQALLCPLAPWLSLYLPRVHVIATGALIWGLATLAAHSSAPPPSSPLSSPHSSLPLTSPHPPPPSSPSFLSNLLHVLRTPSFLIILQFWGAFRGLVRRLDERHVARFWPCDLRSDQRRIRRVVMSTVLLRVVPQDARFFWVYFAVLVVMGFMISWNDAAVEQPHIRGNSGSARLRTDIYALDRACEMSVAAFAPPTVGFLGPGLLSASTPPPVPHPTCRRSCPFPSCFPCHSSSCSARSICG
ncbi:unnamed protein product [Closterium sp. Naga37s-1]|nr:unnamed protein product [Closterium sp. Naga37s-1]